MAFDFDKYMETGNAAYDEMRAQGHTFDRSEGCEFDAYEGMGDTIERHGIQDGDTEFDIFDRYVEDTMGEAENEGWYKPRA